MILSLPSFPHVFSGGSTVLTTGEFGLDPIDLWGSRNLSGRFRFLSREICDHDVSSSVLPRRGNSDSLDRSIDLFHVLR